MNNQKLNFYKASGIATPLNIFLVIICSLVTILFLSYFYSLIVSFIPIIYLNIVIVVIYGFIVSYTSRIFNIIFKIRNQKKSIIITLVLALFAVYFQWVSFLFIISNEKFSLFMVFEQFDYFLNILFRPDLVVLNMIEINKVGTWSLGLSDINLTGLLLWIIWIAEAAIIIFGAYMSFTNFDEIPFSERDNNWFRKEFIDFDFEHITFKQKFIKNFELNPSESIFELSRGDGLRHSRLSVFGSQTESKSLLTIDNVFITQSGRGKKEVTTVLKHCYIDNLHLSKLKEEFILKKASIFDY